MRKKKKTISEKRPFTLEKGKNPEKTSKKRKNLEKKKKKNQIREEALYIREGEEPREKKNQKQKEREERDQSGWL